MVNSNNSSLFLSFFCILFASEFACLLSDTFAPLLEGTRKLISFATLSSLPIRLKEKINKKATRAISYKRNCVITKFASNDETASIGEGGGGGGYGL